MKKQIRVYVATPIRGEHGNEATFEQMQANAKIALGGLDWLERHFPWVEFFCPAVHDRIVQRLATRGYVTYDQILECDHEEQALCQVFVAFTWAPSSGVDQERVLAQELGQPQVIIGHPNDLTTQESHFNNLFQLFAHLQLVDGYRRELPSVVTAPIQVALTNVLDTDVAWQIIEEHVNSRAQEISMEPRSVMLDGTYQKRRIGRDHDDDTSCIS